MPSFEQDHLDVLQSIEAHIVQVYRAEPSLLDLDVKDAIDALVRHYRAEEEQMNPPALRLSDLSRKVFTPVQDVCEWQLGRLCFLDGDSEVESPTPLAELVECLRKVQKSIQRWNRQNGRQGYLQFVVQYVR